MPKALTLGNGKILINIDGRGQVRDLYFPMVGEENHVSEHCVHRVGVWVSGIGLKWLEDNSWSIAAECSSEALAGSVRAVNTELGVSLVFQDVVYNEKNVFIRKVIVKNLSEEERLIKIFFAHQFEPYEAYTAHTAYYDPLHHSIIHYRNKRAFLINAQIEGKSFDDFTTGVFGIEGKEGSHKDAEDGILSKNPIEHGHADSVIGLGAKYKSKEEKFVHYWLAAGTSIKEALELNEYVIEVGASHMLKTTSDFWRAWVNRQNFNFYNLDEDIISLFHKSLFVVRAHVDAGGGIIASGDSEMLQKGKDNYAYVWPRDASYTAVALDKAGDSTVSQRFFGFCNEVLSEGGYFMHKYSPDQSLGSSWHGWLRDGQIELPIQEDETAIVLWALWHHYEISKDLEFVEYIYNSLIKKAADFLVTYRDTDTGLPKPSYDLWEEKFGIHTYTVASVYGALVVAAKFANLLGKIKSESVYYEAANEVRVALFKHLYDGDKGMFRKSVIVKNGELIYDNTPDISNVYGVFNFDVLPVDDDKLKRAFEKTIEAIANKNNVRGIARYKNDLYYRVDPSVPGNPWFVTTLWMAQYYIAIAKSEQDLHLPKTWLNWVVKHSTSSGLLSEQLNPVTGEPLSACPLTWSHAEYVRTVIAYLDKCEKLGLCQACNPVY